MRDFEASRSQRLFQRRLSFVVDGGYSKMAYGTGCDVPAKCRPCGFSAFTKAIARRTKNNKGYDIFGECDAEGLNIKFAGTYDDLSTTPSTKYVMELTMNTRIKDLNLHYMTFGHRCSRFTEEPHYFADTIGEGRFSDTSDSFPNNPYEEEEQIESVFEKYSHTVLERLEPGVEYFSGSISVSPTSENSDNKPTNHMGGKIFSDENMTAVLFFEDLEHTPKEDIQCRGLPKLPKRYYLGVVKEEKLVGQWWELSKARAYDPSFLHDAAKRGCWSVSLVTNSNAQTTAKNDQPTNS